MYTFSENIRVFLCSHFCESIYESFLCPGMQEKLPVSNSLYTQNFSEKKEGSIMALFIELVLMGVGLAMEQTQQKTGTHHWSLFWRISGTDAICRMAPRQSVPAVYHQYRSLDCFYSPYLYRWKNDVRSNP